MRRMIKGLILSSVVLLASCALNPINTSDEIIGKYQITKRDCTGSTMMISHCESINVIEFVRGNFYTISDDDIAFVIWHGDVDAELMYTARKYVAQSAVTTYPFIATIDRDPGFNEFVIFYNSNQGQYELTRRFENRDVNDQVLLEIVRIPDNGSSDFLMNYPEND